MAESATSSSSRSAHRLPAAGAAVELEVRQLVRDGAVTLYGFSTIAEKQAFDLLTRVQHVGPKLALAVLSRSEIDAALLRNAAYTTVARGFGLVDVSVRRHAVKHIPKLINEIRQNYAIRQGVADIMAQASKPTEAAERSMRANESLVVTPIASAEDVLREISAMAMVNPQDRYTIRGAEAQAPHQ